MAAPTTQARQMRQPEVQQDPNDVFKAVMGPMAARRAYRRFASFFPTDACHVWRVRIAPEAVVERAGMHALQSIPKSRLHCSSPVHQPSQYIIFSPSLSLLCLCLKLLPPAPSLRVPILSCPGHTVKVQSVPVVGGVNVLVDTAM